MPTDIRMVLSGQLAVGNFDGFTVGASRKRECVIVVQKIHIPSFILEADTVDANLCGLITISLVQDPNER